MSIYRRVEKQTENGWLEIDFKDIKDGDIFRMYEPDGNIVKYNELETFTATGDSFLDDETGEWMVMIDLKPEEENQ